MRGLEQGFIDNLLSGVLKPILEVVKSNQDLQLEIRGNYINIYYKGGNALKISRTSRSYSYEFDEKYCVNSAKIHELPIVTAIKSKDPQQVLSVFPLIFESMDTFFVAHPKPERTIQHELISGSHQGLRVVDIEYAGWNIDKRLFRLDMIGVVKIENGYRLVIIENKSGTSSIGGSAGIKKHYNDIVSIINDPTAFDDMKQSVVNIIQNKHDLGLLDFSLNIKDLTETEILFVMVDFNDRSKALDNAVASIAKSTPAKIIYMSSDKPDIPYSEAKDLFQWNPSFIAELTKSAETS